MLCATVDQLAVLISVELQKLAVRAIGVAIGIRRIGVRRVIFYRRKKLTVMTLLELRNICPADGGSNANELLRDFHITFMVTANFGDDLNGSGGI